jgi:hypothetical protein
MDSGFAFPFQVCVTKISQRVSSPAACLPAIKRLPKEIMEAVTGPEMREQS